MIILNADRHATVIDNDGCVSFLRLPSPFDGRIDELFELFNSLPQKLCLVLDRRTGHVKILQIDDARLANFGQSIPSQSPLSTTGDELNGEILQSRAERAEDHGAKEQIGDFLLIARHARPLRSDWRAEQDSEGGGERHGSSPSEMRDIGRTDRGGLI